MSVRYCVLVIVLFVLCAFAYATTRVSAQVTLTSCSFLTDLKVGMTHPDVARMQKVLNANPATRIAASGPGAPGFESTYFGTLTLRAVHTFQRLNGLQVSLAQPGGAITVGTTGYVGQSTRAALNRVCGQYFPAIATAQPAPAAPTAPPPRSPLAIAPSAPAFTPPPPFQVSCTPTISGSNVNAFSIRWSTTVSGIGNQTPKFSWSGTSNLRGSGAAVTKSYSSAGTKTATVVVTVGDQKVTTTCPEVRVTSRGSLALPGQTTTPRPLTVSCTVSPTTIVAGQSADWSATANGGQGNYVYSWSGSDNLIGTASVIRKSYTLVGPKSATVKVTSGTLSKTQTCPVLTVAPVVADPTPAIVASCAPSPSQAQTGQSVTWSATASGGTGTFTYSWNGDDGLTGSTAAVSKTYSSVGTKNASVIVQSGTRQSIVNCSAATIIPSPNQAPLAQSVTGNLYKDASVATYTQRIITFMQIGSQPHDSRRHALHEDVPTPPGFNYWFDRHNGSMVTHQQSGYERMVIWFPFGWKEDELSSDWLLPRIFPFSVYENAQQQTPWLTERFVEYWKPIVGSGVEIIAYIGNPLKDKKMKLLESNEAEWFAAAHREVKPFTDSGMSIAFDYINSGEINSLSWRFVEQLMARGVRVYSENPPENWSAGHWGKLPFFTFEWPHPRPQVMTNPDGEIIGTYYHGGSVTVTNARRWLGAGISTAIGIPLWNGSMSDNNIRQFLPELANTVAYITPQATDAENDPITFRIVGQPSKGTVALHPQDPKVFVYTANSSFTSGTDTFTYVANDGRTDSAPATVTIQLQNEMPLVTAQQMMTAARQAGGGSNSIIAVWPLTQRDIQELNIDDNVPATFTPKRVITFNIGGQPRSFIVGYETATFTPKAYAAMFAQNQLLITSTIDASPERSATEAQYAAVSTAADSTSSNWLVSAASAYVSGIYDSLSYISRWIVSLWYQLFV